MGSYTRLPPSDDDEERHNSEESESLGAFVAGRFSEVSIDSVGEVRRLREDE